MMFTISLIIAVLFIYGVAIGFWTWDTKNNIQDRASLILIIVVLLVQTVRLEYASMKINIDLGSETPNRTEVLDV